jgi:hypothetical protein
MLATILFPIPLFVGPHLPLPQPTRDCLLEVLTPQALEQRAVTEFGTRVHGYVGLRRRLVRSIRPAPRVDDEGGMLGDELRAAIVAARPDARQGDFFSAPVAAALRARIDSALVGGVADVPPRLFHRFSGSSPTVNAEFSDVGGAGTWPALLGELPALPTELGYALWGRDLVLLDLAANLVIDVLSDALPPGICPDVQDQ